MFSADAFVDIFSRAVEYSEKNKAPLYCGEYGVIENAEPDAVLRWFKDINTAFERCGISRAIWSYNSRRGDFGIPNEKWNEIFNQLKMYF